jgi:hypothetical protein
MISLSIVLLAMMVVFLLVAFWQLVISPSKRACNAMPGGIDRLRIANIVFITTAFGPIFGVLFVEALGVRLPTFSTLLAIVTGSLLSATIATFGPLSALLSDARNAGLSYEKSNDGETSSDHN